MSPSPAAPAIRRAVRSLSLASLAKVVAEPIVHVEHPPWATSTPTAIVSLQSGTRVVVQERRGSAGVAAIRLVSRSLGEAGIRVPLIVGAGQAGRRQLIVLEFVAGAVGSTALDGPGGLPAAARMGVLAARIRDAPIDGLAVATAWQDPARLRRAANAWSCWLPGKEGRDRLTAAGRRLGVTGWTPVTSHGDFAPINVLLDGARPAALLDLGDVMRRHPLIDAAWWQLVVRHHHRHLFERLAPVFARAAGIADRDALALLPPLALLRSAELLAVATSAQAPHRRALVASALAWSGEVDRHMDGSPESGKGPATDG